MKIDHKEDYVRRELTHPHFDDEKSKTNSNKDYDRIVILQIRILE